MSIYNKWVDFVTFPTDLDKITSEGQRINTFDLVHGLEGEEGFLVTQNNILFDEDEFEAMEINKGGAVTIWTKKRVWTLHRDRGLEKLFYVPRHPNLD